MIKKGTKRMSEQFSFQDLPSFLTQVLREQGITEPTDIQKKMIPEAIAGQNMIARSQTGTGKTLAYLLPALAKLEPEKKGLQTLIIVPTQELAMQVVEVARALTKEQPIVIDAFIGGANIKRQLERLKKQKPQLAVGTPGRLLELIEMKKLKVHEAEIVIVDEADRMVVEQPSWEATLQIARRTGRDAQYLFVSATIPANFAQMVGDVIPFLVEVEAEGGLLHTEKVEHLYIRVDERERIDMVRRLIHAESIQKGIVFANKLETVNETVEKLSYRKINVLALSSDQSKQERERALQQFRQGEVNILVATDLAARGLDVDDVTHIIQLDPPANSDSYLHRAGRTGRIGKEGTVMTLIAMKDEYKVDKYHRDLNIVLKECVLTHGKLMRK